MKKTIATGILLFFAGIMMLALFDAPLRLETFESNAKKSGEPVSAPSVETLTAAERKQHFVEKTLPAILNVKSKLDALYEYVLLLSRKKNRTPQEDLMLDALKKRYKVAGIPCLLNRLKTHPVSIVLAQAALESGWGRSRFYNEANNIFGIWSYSTAEPRIAAGETRGAKTIYVKKYPTLEASIEGYFNMMATGRAYGEFRKARKSEANPFKLIRHLSHYSELREEYIKRLYYVIKANRLYRYDTPSFKPLTLAQVLPEAIPGLQTADRSDTKESRLAAASIPALQMEEVPLQKHDDVMEEENVSECPPAISQLEENLTEG